MPRLLRSTASAFRVWRDSPFGVAAIEFAIMAPLLALLLVAVAELGFAFRQKMQAQDAAAAGALYAAQHGWDPAGIVVAVTGAKASSGIAATPGPVLFCGCPSAAGIVASVCATTCPDGSFARSYVQASASVTRTTFLPAPFSLPATLTATSTMRIP